MEFENNYENIPVSEKTLEGMHLTIDDRAYLQRMFTLQDEVIKDYINDTYDKHAVLICDTVREMLNEIRNELKEIKSEIEEIKDDLKYLHTAAEENRRNIRELQKGFKEHEFRISRIEKKLEL